MAIRTVIEQTEAQPVQTLTADATGKLVVPGAEFLFDGQFHRSGHDLVLSNDNAADIRIPGYFLSDPPADLFDPSGAVIRGAHVALMAGPIAPGQYAQAGADIGASPVGQVEVLDGDASVQRVDGTVEMLQVGMKIFQNDVLQTGEDTSLSVTFVDGTIFTLASASRMIIDELIYDPDGSDNSGGFSLIQGSFVFIAGQVAKTGGMEVNTPSSTMGIRGTTVVVEVSSENGVVTSEITLAEDIDGEIGRIELFDIEGNLIADIQETINKWVVQAFDGAVREVSRSPQDELSDSILIAEAFAAFRAATSRVEAGDTFVTLTDPAAVGQIDNGGEDVDIDFNVDSIDDPDTIAPPDAIEEVPEVDDTLPLDEGLNLQQDAPVPEEQTIIVVQGNEDASEEDAIVGSVAIEALAGQVFSLDNGPGNGVVQFNPDGSFSFVPNPNFNGEDVFTFVAENELGEIEQGTVVITVLPVNDAPEAEDFDGTVAEDGILSGAIAAQDIDNDVLNYSVTGLPASGEVLLFQNGNFTYTPDPDFSGVDSFVVTVTDAEGETALSTVTVTVNAEDDRPFILTAVDEVEQNLIEGDDEIVVGGTLLADDPDAGAVLVWSGNAVGNYGVFSITPGGDWTYTVDPDAADALLAGQVVTETFTATVTDEDGLSQSIEIPISITGTEDLPDVVSPPTAALGALTEGAEVFEVSGQVVANDPDAGATVTWTGVSQAQFGSFTIAEDGSWTYALDNALADVLTEGQVVVETLLAVAEDNGGNSVQQAIEVSITGTNDQPVLTPVVTFETIEEAQISGALSANDVDGSVAELTYSLGPNGAENGTVALNPDGSFTFTPSAGFVGIASFEYQVADADGGVTNGLARVLVENDPDNVPNQNVGLGLNLVANDDAAAGAVEITVQKVDTTSINLAIALDRSGSIGAQAWGNLLTAVQTSVTSLADLFDGADTQIDVQIITYASDVDATQIYDLQDPALIAAITPGNLTYSGGATAWNLAFQQTGAFFFNEPSNELNYLLFVTDGIPSSGTWVEPFDALIDPTDDFDVTVDAFGFGAQYQVGSLDALDDDPVTFSEPSQLTAAFQETPIFNPELIGFTIELVADGGSVLEIADETSDALIVEGTNFELPLASIANIAELLGEVNQIDITAQFDLDNDFDEAEVTLVRSEVIGKAATAQTLTGRSGDDLLFGSDAADSIEGAGGGDVVLAYGGDDTLIGGAGADTLLAGAGDDTIRLTTLPEDGDKVDGGAGRDTLAFEAVGQINDMIATLDFSSIEALDITNGAFDDLTLSVDEVIAFSDEDDTALQDLLDAALPNARSFYGDAGDGFTIDGQGLYSVEVIDTVADAEGNSLDVYAFNIGGGNPLATLGIDTDIDVTTVNVV